MASDFQDCPLFNEHRQVLTRDEMDVVIKETVKETLLSMGVDTTDPIEMQRDFQALRDWRRAAAAMRSRGLMTLIVVLTTGVISAIWIGVKYALKQP